MDILAQAVEKIVKEQEAIIGPVALEQAKKVKGVSIDPAKQEITIQSNQETVLSDLVKQYEHLFGKASVEVCKEAIKDIADKIPKDQLPPVLAS